MPSPAVEAHNLSFSYTEGQPVLEKLNFRIERGDYVGIIGPNGGGKTTLLKIMLGLLEPKSGSLKLFGLPPSAARARGWLGYVPQKVAQADFPFPITAQEVISSSRGRSLWNRTRRDANAVTLQHVLDITGVKSYAHQPMSKLSGGMRQRVFIARALITRPRLLLLDEPAVGVDFTSQKRFFAFLKRLHRHRRTTTVLVSHDIDMVINEVKTVICLNRSLLCHTARAKFHREMILPRLYHPATKPGKQVFPRRHIHHHA